MPDDRSSKIVPASDPPASDPPASDPPASDPPASDPLASDPLASDPLAHGDEPTGAADRRAAAAANAERSTAPPMASVVHVDSQKTVISKRPPVSPPAFRRAASPFEMGEALEGEQLGHFQLEEFVGGGGMGAVFRATDTMLGRTVAVKVVSRDQTNEDTLRRFKNEAQSAARLDHPNIARVYYVGEDKGWNYIVLEYIEGVNVRDLVEHNGPLTLEDAISYVLQIAEALEHASQRDVTHRDIKPSNILIMVDGRAKLVDMGLARLQQVESSTDDLTASGVTLGTFDYISPEQARDPRNTDVRSDLYSLGCTLFFMLTGMPPFPDGTVLQKLLSHSSDEPPNLNEYRPDLDEQVAQIVNKLLAKQPDQRYQSPRELIGELLVMADRLDLSGIRAKSTVWFTRSDQEPVWWSRHLPWAAAVVSLLLFLLVYNWVDSAAPTPLPDPPRLANNADANTTALPPASDAIERPSTKQPAPMEAPSSPGEGDSPATTAVPDRAKKVDAASEVGPKVPTPSVKPSKNTATAQETVPVKKETPAKKGPSVSADVAPKVDPSPRPDPATESEIENSSSTPPATEAIAGVQVIVVTDQPLAVDEKALSVRSLDQALIQAAMLQKSVEIELRFDGLRLLEPLVIDTDRFFDNQITIRAARGSSPILAFRPSTDANSSVTTPSMIQIIGGHVDWLGVHFYLELPPVVEPHESRSLLRLDTTDRTEFRNCTFTLRNIDPEGTAAPRRVAFVDVVGAGDFGGALFNSRPLAGDAAAIRLENCIARGQAPFIRADFAVPFSFSWEHGLFVSTERLVEVGGTFFEPRFEHGSVNIFLKRLLSAADQGICLVRSDHVAPYQLGVSIKCDDCLFATKVTTPPTPLYVVRIGSTISQGLIPLVIHGNRNYYKNTQVVLRVETSGDRNAIEQYSFDDITGSDSQSWFNEKGPEPAPAAIFSWDVPSLSVDRQTLHDFIPPGGGDGWFTQALSLTPSQLPTLPDITELLLQLPAKKDPTTPPQAATVPKREPPSPPPQPVSSGDELLNDPLW